jgi:hypothetical protein
MKRRTTTRTQTKGQRLCCLMLAGPLRLLQGRSSSLRALQLCTCACVCVCVWGGGGYVKLDDSGKQGMTETDTSNDDQHWKKQYNNATKRRKKKE